MIFRSRAASLVASVLMRANPSRVRHHQVEHDDGKSAQAQLEHRLATPSALPATIALALQDHL
jgi:hypothetical protein